jgi:TolB-like protein/Flp pilus assembly protein TadD
MSSERWERVKQIYAAALEVEPGRREKFLREACGGDDSLLEEVRSLLAQGGKSEDVLESPPLQVVARVLAAEGAHDSPEDLSGRMLSHSGESSFRSITESGLVLGTVSYMSPEQVLGHELDRRTDLFSLGTVLYALATGHPAFSGGTATEVMDRILHVQPDAITRLSPKAPPELERIVGKCLEKDRELRYQHAAELTADLKRLKRDLDSAKAATEAPRLEPRSLLSISLRREPLIQAALVAAILLVVTLGWWILTDVQRADPPGEIRSIAVLPLENLSGDPEQDYFVDGMMDAIITDLSKISALKVISRNSAMRFKGSDRSTPEIATILGVDAVVEGAALQAGDQVRITAQLVDGASDRHIWAESYVRDLKDVLRLQSEVALAIAVAVGTVVTEEERRLKGDQVNPMAYQLYLKGNFQFERLTKDGLRRAIGHYQEAVSIDPDYAPASSGLAIALMESAGWHGWARPESVHESGKSAALRALELDPNLGEAHIALGRVLLQERDWAAADREFRRGLELNPSWSYARLLYAIFLTVAGRFQEAIEAGRRTLELDPLSPIPYNDLAWILEISGGSEESLELHQKALKIEPHFGQTNGELALYYVRRGMLRTALRHADEVVRIADQDQAGYLGLSGFVYGAAGKRAEAEALLNQLVDRREKEHVSASAIARILLGLGEKENALEWLERAYQEKDLSLVWLRHFWIYDPLRSDPRFQDLLHRMHFPE